MRSNRPAARQGPLGAPEDFSFVLGGPLFQLFRRLHLSGDGLELAHRRIIFMAAFAWVPLLVLSAVQGRAMGGSVAVPFLRDIEAHGRFLLVVPLLVAAEIMVHQRIRFVARQFLERELIPAGDRSRFDAAVASTIRLRNSIPAELALIALVYGVGILIIWRRFTALDTATWYATPSAEGMNLSLAGMWLAFVSLPLAQFLLVRWYYRMFLWTRFLWKVARIDLRLVPTHPDQLGGLAFLSMTTSAFAPLAVAHGALVSGWIASRIFLDQAALLDFKIEIAAVAVLLMLLVFGPFLVFAPQLGHARRQGERDYGPLAQRYTHEFAAKWVRSDAPPREPLLGSHDIQSLADLATAYTVVRTMRVLPITKEAVVQLVVATLAPIAPLVLTMMPLGDLVKRVAGMLF
ncbi:MAG: hypothetical protein ACRET3_08025 [Burkholderiales bacterium]